MSFALLIAAVLLIWDRNNPASLIGAILALTPTVLFIGTVIAPSGPELGAAAAVLAFLLRVTRDGMRARWIWPAGIVASSALCLARPLGPIWLATLVVCALLLNGRTRLTVHLGLGERWLPLGAFVVSISTILSLGWELLVLPPESHPASQLLAFIGVSLAAVPEAFGEAIGVFGWQDTLMPRIAYAIWGLAMLAVIVPALLRGRRQERRGLDMIIVLVGVAIVSVSALVELPTGFAVQGRHVLPILMAMLMISGEILYRNSGGRISSRTVGRIGAASGGIVAAIQFVGWYSNAHRYAVGTSGPWLFLSSAEWSPPGGWFPTTALAVLGAVTMFLVAISTPRQSHHR